MLLSAVEGRVVLLKLAVLWIVWQTVDLCHMGLDYFYSSFDNVIGRSQSIPAEISDVIIKYLGMNGHTPTSSLCLFPERQSYVRCFGSSPQVLQKEILMCESI